MDVPAPLLRAILDAPDDDAPRLVLADWLLENGDPERGEYIVLSCAVEATPWGALEQPDRAARARALLDRNRARWISDLGVDGLSRVTFRRGFVEEVELGAKGVVRALRGLRGRTPIRHLVLVAATAHQLAKLTLRDELRALQSVAFRGLQIDAAAAAALFSAESFVTTLGSVSFEQVWLDPNAIQILQFAAPTTLTRASFDLAFGPLLPGEPEPADPDLTALFLSPALRGLEGLDTRRGARQAAGFAARKTYPRLRSLRAAGAGDEEVIALAGAGLALTEVDLDGPIGPIAIEAFARAPFVPTLRSLRLDVGAGDRETAQRTLLHLISKLRAVERLHLTGVGMGDDALGFVAACVNLAELRSFDLGGWNVTDRGLRALAQSTHLPKLEEISGGAGLGLRIEPATREALVRRFARVELYC